MTTGAPHVSIVTPVYNGVDYLGRCIESVVAQTYTDWTYTLVDNCSTDGSYELALKAAATDPRIRVIRNDTFVGVIENHNRAFRQLSAESEYCKLLSADDWIVPDYLAKLVRVAEAYPTAAMVSCNVINKHGIARPGLPADRNFFVGREVVRQFLLGQIERFWLPTSVLYRARFVRAQRDFYPGAAPSADLEACLACLSDADLGFVHEALAYERIHEKSVTAGVIELNSTLLDRIRIFQQFGRPFLDERRFRARLDVLLSKYYSDVLAAACFQGRGVAFWKFHAREIERLGYSVYNWRLFRGLLSNAWRLTSEPVSTVHKIARKLRNMRRLESRHGKGC